MGNFDRNDRGGNRGGGFRGGNGGGHKSFGGGNRGPVTMHKAVCDECHKNCEVPFRPSGDKPIYCNECFGGKKEGGRNDRNNHGDRNDRKDFGNFKPRKDFGNRDSKHFAQNNSNSNISEDIKKQLSEMNSKLDRLVISLEKLSLPKVEVSHSSPKVEVKKAPVKTEVKVAPKALAKAPVKAKAKAPAKTSIKKVVTKKKK